MILLLLLGISFVGIGTALLARAVANPERGTPPVAQIQRYGFTKRRGDRPKVAIGGLFARDADSVGERFVGRLGKGDEIRRELVAAGMYRVTVTKFLGYRILATIGLPLIWIWFATTTSQSPIIAFVGLLACGALDQRGAREHDGPLRHAVHALVRALDRPGRDARRLDRTDPARPRDRDAA